MSELRNAAQQEPVAWMQEMPVSGNEERSVRMTTVKMVADEWHNPIPLYLAPTPQPEQPVATKQMLRWVEHLKRLSDDGQHMSIPGLSSGACWELAIELEQFIKNTAPTPQREHITDGSPCWCNPDVIEEEGGNVIVHNYEDNWQQYAKPGETAQQCIERHRGEQDALMKLYATPRKPLTDEEIVDIYKKWDATPGVSMADFARAIERAHGIGEQHE